jgi:hypothetical protein
LKKATDGIWKVGDKGESAIKHMNHAVVAIAYSGSWSNLIDYDSPNPDSSSVTTDVLNSLWTPVELLRANMSQDEFVALVKNENLGVLDYFDFYLDIFGPDFR